MKKYRITDESGEQYEVEEVEEKTVDEEPVPEVHDEEQLLPEEIAALKKLAAAADQLIALIDVEKEEHDVESFDDDEEVEEVEEKEEEQLVDTDEKVKGCDSKKSFGAIERKKKTIDDSLTDEISDAWNKRYGGNK